MRECKYSETQSKKLNSLLKQFKNQRSYLETNYGKFWKIVKESLFSLDNANESQIKKRIEIETDYRYEIQNDFTISSPLPIPLNLEGRIPHSLYKRVYIRRDLVWNQNVSKHVDKCSELLGKLCEVDLEARLGKSFKGLYPFSGVDFQAPYQFGGKWLLVDMDRQPFRQEEKEYITQYTIPAIQSNRIELHQEELLVKERVQPSVKIRNWNSDVILLKGANVGSCETTDLIRYLSTIIKKKTLLISDQRLNSDQRCCLPLISDFLGKSDCNECYFHNPRFSGGGKISPLTKVFVYLFDPLVERDYIKTDGLYPDS